MVVRFARFLALAVFVCVVGCGGSSGSSKDPEQPAGEGGENKASGGGAKEDAAESEKNPYPKRDDSILYKDDNPDGDW